MTHGARSGRVVRALLFAGAAGLVLTGVVASGCGSMAVEEVKQETLSLPKNARLLEHLRAGVLTGTGEPWMAAYLPSLPLDARAAGSEAPPVSEAPGPIVLVHGTPDGMGAWTRVLFGEDGLAGQEDIYALEVLGHGMLGVDEGTVTFQRCADHVAATLGALGLDRGDPGGELLRR